MNVKADRCTKIPHYALILCKTRWDYMMTNFVNISYEQVSIPSMEVR